MHQKRSVSFPGHDPPGPFFLWPCITQLQNLQPPLWEWGKWFQIRPKGKLSIKLWESGFRNGPAVPKTSSGGDGEQECRLNHPLTVSLKINSGLAFFLLEIKAKEHFFLIKPTKKLFFAFLTGICCSKSLSGHCHSSHLSTCNLLSFSPVISLSARVISVGGGAHCYHWAVIRCVSSLKSEKVQLHLLGGSTVAAWLPSIFQVLFRPYVRAYMGCFCWEENFSLWNGERNSFLTVNHHFQQM